MPGKFLTPIEDFDYKPLVVDGKIVRGKVVIEGDILWLDSEGFRYLVPDGFVCDLASMPLSGTFLKKLGRHQRSAALHDYLYSKRKVHKKSKRWADRQFREGMRYDFVAPKRRMTMWSGVAAFGWFSWYGWGTAH